MQSICRLQVCYMKCEKIAKNCTRKRKNTHTQTLKHTVALALIAHENWQMEGKKSGKWAAAHEGEKYIERCNKKYLPMHRQQDRGLHVIDTNLYCFSITSAYWARALSFCFCVLRVPNSASAKTMCAFGCATPSWNFPNHCDAAAISDCTTANIVHFYYYYFVFFHLVATF